MTMVSLREPDKTDKTNGKDLTLKAVFKAANLLAFHDTALNERERKDFQKLVAHYIDKMAPALKAEIAQLFAVKPIEKFADPLQLHLIASSDSALYEPVLRDAPYIHASHILELLLSSDHEKRAILATRPDLNHTTTAALIRLGAREPLDHLIQNPHVIWSNGLLALLMESKSSLIDPLYRLVAGPAHLGPDQLAYAYWHGSKAVKLGIIERISLGLNDKAVTFVSDTVPQAQPHDIIDQLQTLGHEGNITVIARNICHWLDLPESLAPRFARNQDGLNLIIALKVLGISDEITLLALGCLWVRCADLEAKLEEALNHARLFSRGVACIVVDLWRKHEMKGANSLKSHYQNIERSEKAL